MCAGGGIPKSVWWSNEIKVGIKRKEVAVKEVLGARSMIWPCMYKKIDKRVLIYAKDN